MRVLKCMIVILIGGLWLSMVALGWEEGTLSDEEELILCSPITNLAWSPDGSKIAFTGYLQGFDHPADIYVVDINTKKVTNLTNTPDISENGPIVWSPDGTYLVYEVVDTQIAESGSAEDIHHLWLMKADGSERRLLNTRPCQNAVWSPDGQFILAMGWFSGPEREGYDPLLMTKDGDEIKLMEFDGYPLSWSPNGRYILFYDIVNENASGGAAATLLRYDLSTGEILQLTSPGQEDVAIASFFQNGTKIWYWNWKDDNLWIMNVEGSDKQMIDLYGWLPENLALALLPCPALPSPTGQKIAFIAWYCDSTPSLPPYNIYLINPDGTGLEQITFFTGIPVSQAKAPHFPLITALKGKVGKPVIAQGMKVKANNDEIGTRQDLVEGKGSTISKTVQAKRSVEPKTSGERTKIAKNVPLIPQRLPIREDTPKSSQVPLLAGGLSLSALSYAVWKFLKLLS